MQLADVLCAPRVFASWRVLASWRETGPSSDGFALRRKAPPRRPRSARPIAEQFSRLHDLAEMIRVVIRDQQHLAQVCLTFSVRDLRR